MKNLLNKSRAGFFAIILAGLITSFSGNIISSNAKDYFIERVKAERKVESSYIEDFDYKTKVGTGLELHGFGGSVVGIAGVVITSIKDRKRKEKEDYRRVAWKH